MQCKDIIGYSGIYQIYPNGWVYSIKNNKFLKQSVDSVGYLRINLCKDGIVKQHRIHKLLAEHFLENPSNYLHIDHINRDRQNNSIDNLRWCSPRQNSQNRGVFESEYGHNIDKTKYGKFQVRFYDKNKKTIYSKNFKTHKEAIKARDDFLNNLNININD